MALLLPPIALVGALIALAPAVSAEIYRWTDAEGRLHFTQDLERVPREQRERARAAARRPTSAAVQTYASPTPPARAVAARASRYDQEVRVPFRAEGNLMRVTARVNDQLDVPFLIDTGASGVSLPSRVAEQLGIRVGPETPTVHVTTANGVVSRPVVLLDAIELARARVERLEATINPSMSVGLLGGTFFNNFVYRVDAAESVITLVPNDQIRGGLRERDWRQRFQSLRDPLARLEGHLERGVVQRRGELEILERRRAELRARLDELESEANRLDVPHAWRE
jgi:clan AA aspartic protease (TIGR02281 family)